MAKKKQFDSKTLAIIILAIIIAVETFILFSPAKKAREVSLPAVSRQIKKEAKSAPPQKRTSKNAARVAIIIDDCGNGSDTCDYLAKINGAVTASILPDLPYTKTIAECAHTQGKGVMLHLPLEPHRYFETYPAGYIIKTTMEKKDIEDTTNRAIDEIPFVEGINNHMGSKATEDKRVMGIIFSILKQRGLFFIDSLVTTESVCKSLARQAGIPFNRRNVFLDNKNERAYIEHQFSLVVDEAKEKGSAIAIGHARTLTLEVLKDEVESYQKQGIEFVTAKDLAR